MIQKTKYPTNTTKDTKHKMQDIHGQLKHKHANDNTSIYIASYKATTIIKPFYFDLEDYKCLIVQRMFHGKARNVCSIVWDLTLTSLK